jgi:hypothetical protein
MARGLKRDCRNCLHYEACGGFQYGCYPSFPAEEEEDGGSDLEPDTLDEAKGV